MTGRGSKRRLPSGIQAIDIGAAIAQRRIRLASDGLESGRWCLAVEATAKGMARRRDLPVDDESWCAYLDALEASLEPNRPSAVISCRAVREIKDETG